MIRMRGLTCLLSLSAAAWASSNSPWGMAFNNDGSECLLSLRCNINADVP